VLAYGYNIKCQGILTEVEDNSYETIEIKKSVLLSVKDKVKFKLKFFNNQGRELTLYTDKKFVTTQEGQLWSFEVKDVVTLFWYSGTMKIAYIAHENFTDALLKYWCLHICLPTFLTIEEKYDFLHAGAVEVEGQPILFTAESFGGKSTMTDYFLKQGITMVSDDKVGCFEEDGNYMVVPSHPHHRPHRKMEDLGFYVENTAKEAKPLHVIYELVKSDENASVVFEEVFGIEKFKILRYRSELNLFFLKSKRFTFLANLAKKVPLYRVTVPWDMERLDEVYKMICNHSNSINP